MRINVACLSCGKPYNVDDSLLGKSTRCRQCGQTFTLVASENGASKATALPAGTNGGTKAVAAPTAAPTATVPATRASNAPLDRLARFEIRARLGAGAFGTVYRAFDPQLEREIALKVPQAGVLDSPKRVERFLREAKSAAQLRHPNIVPIYDAGQKDGHHYIASAFIQGHTLSDVIDDKGMNPRRAAQIVSKLAEALAYAHQLGIVHRDIKPANVMIDDDDMPHLMDFGLAARTESTEKLTQDGAILGTPAYMAPEHAAGHSGESFPDSDQYSLGVVLYELLTGKTPWEGPPQIVLYNVLHKEPPKPRSLRKDIPRDLETICLKAMAKEPKHRFRDCQAMADDLRRWLEGEPVKARRPNFGERLVRWVKREPKMAAAVVFSLVGLITLAVGLGLLAQHLEGEVAGEKTAHGGTKKSLSDEQAGHQLTKGDRYTKQVGLAKEQIDGHDLTGGMHTLAPCPPELRGWEWGHLRQLAEGSPDAFHVLNGKGRVLHLQFSGDSRNIFSQHPRGIRMNWNLASLQATDEKQAVALEEWSPAKFSGDGKLVATLFIAPAQPPAGPGEEVKFPPAKVQVRETGTGKMVSEITIPGGINIHTLSDDGTKVAVAHAAKFRDPLKITIYDVQSGQESSKLDGEFESIVGLVLSPDAGSLAIVSGGGLLISKKKVTEQHQKEVDGKLETYTTYREVEEAKTSGNGGGVSVVETSTGKVQFAKESLGMSRAVFAPDGKRFCYLHGDGVDVFSLADGKELFTLRGCAGAIAFSPDGKRIATAAGQNACPPDGLVKLWDAGTGQFLVAVRTKGYVLAYDTLLFSPDGAWLAAVPARGSQIFLFSTSGGRLTTPYYDHGAPVASVTWSPDGKLLSSWSDCNQTARVWDAVDGSTQLVVSNQFASGLGFSTSGKYLSTGGGCLGAVPHMPFGGHGMHGGGNGAYGGQGGGCYGMANFGSVNVFSVSGFKPMPPPKGYDAFLAASNNGQSWVVKPSFDSGGKPFSLEQMPKPQLWSVADDKEVLTLSELSFDSRAEFTDDSGRIVGIGMGPAKTTGYKTEYRTEEKIKTVRKKAKDGSFTDEQVKYTVQVCCLVPYEVTVFATHLKLLDAATGKKVWHSIGVDSLFAVSADGKLVATLPPPVPRQQKGMAPIPPPGPKQIDSPRTPKEAPKKLPAPDTTDATDLGFVALQEQKKAPPAPAPAAPAEKTPDFAMPSPMIPSPPITLWVVDEKNNEGEPVSRTLEMPGQVTMMRFSPDGKYLAAYMPHVLEQVQQMQTRRVVHIIDGQRVEKDEACTVTVKRDLAQLKVFETATGKEVLTHVGASGLAIFCKGSGHIASAAGMPKFDAPHMGGQFAPHEFDGAPPSEKKVMPAPERKLAAFRPERWNVASLGQTATGPEGVEPVGWEPPMHGAHGMPYVDTALYVFDLTTGKETHKFHGHASQITALAFSPDCQKLASGSYGVGFSCGDPPGKHFAQINIWDLGSKKLYQSISGHTGAINCMEFDPEGKRLASASDDTTVKVWSVAASLNTSSPGYAVPAPAPAYVSPGVIVQPTPPAPVSSTERRTVPLKVEAAPQ